MKLSELYAKIGQTIQEYGDMDVVRVRSLDIDGIILNKLDGTAKGGVVLAIEGELSVPVVYIGVGEGIDDLQDFNSQEFVDAIFD